jgi:hypothetical protein
MADVFPDAILDVGGRLSKRELAAVMARLAPPAAEPPAASAPEQTETANPGDPPGPPADEEREP